MESLLGPLEPQPLDESELPEPRLWTCEGCNEPMRVWDWGSHPLPSTATVIIPPPALCSACLVEQAGPEPEQQWFVHWTQWQHQQMWYRIGEPLGTLIAWQGRLIDRGGKLNSDGSPIAYPACIYSMHVDWWHDHWPQQTYPWSGSHDWPRLVVLGAYVFAAAGARAHWRYRWWWRNPTVPESCALDPPYVDLTDDEAMDLNRARGAFYAFHERLGRRRGTTLYTPDQLAEMVPVARAMWFARYGRLPRNTELAAELGISEATFKRYKSRGMIPAP